MSITNFRLPPSSFVKHPGVELPGAGRDTRDAGKQRPKGPHETEVAPLRDNHIVLLAIDGVLALHAAVKRYLMRRRTLKILASLDDQQLKDIGLTRDDVSSQNRRGWC